MKKTFLAFVSAALLLLSLVTGVSADRTLPLLVDDGGLLRASEYDDVLAELTAVSESNRCEIAVVTVNSLGGKSAMAYADDFYDDNGYGYGANDDGVLLLVAMNEREYHITTHGAALAKLSDSALMRIEDAFLDDLSDGYYADAFKSFASACSAQLNAADDYGGYGYYDDYGYGYDDGYYYEESSFSVVKALLISLVIGLIAGFIMVNSMKSAMTTVKSATNAQNYVLANSLKLTRESDRFLYTQTQRIPRSDGNSGGRSGRSGGSPSRGGSSHRSSSGRSHGGRGGRF